MKKLSLCMIVKNEEKTLKNCLKNASDYADEIIIVDTGSVDKTKEIAQKFTDKIYDFEWNFDFSKARNYAFARATCQYIIWLDADDIVPDKTVNAINLWKNNEEDCDVVMCPYVTAFNKDFSPTFQFVRERIVKNDTSLRWHDRVHEVIIQQGKIITNEDIKIYHNKEKEKYTNRNLLIYQKMIDEGETFSPRSQFYYARELYFNNKLDEAIHQFSKFLSEGKGWKENNIEACLDLARCYHLKGKISNALSVLFGSFVYDLPRGEILYEIGNIFLEKQDYNSSIYWFKQALNLQDDIKKGGFINVDTTTFLPALQLCVCYDRIGDKKTSFYYHEIAKSFKPDDDIIKKNQEYFDKLLKDKLENIRV